MVDLAGKTALVTGASRGLGEAVARLFAQSGARVAITATTDEGARRVADSIGPGMLAVRLDVTEEQSWTAAVGAVLADSGRLDILVNNAGVYHGADLCDTSLEDYRRVIEVDQMGVFLGMRSVVDAMTAAGGGSIVNVGSIVSHHPYEGVVAYAAAKGAVAAMTRVAAMELGVRGIRVNVVDVGGMQTEMSSPGGMVAPFFARIATGRIGRPEEVAQVVAFLASDESAYCTGAEFRVDGGWSLGRYRADLTTG